MRVHSRCRGGWKTCSHLTPLLPRWLFKPPIMFLFLSHPSSISLTLPPAFCACPSSSSPQTAPRTSPPQPCSTPGQPTASPHRARDALPRQRVCREHPSCVGDVKVEGRKRVHQLLPWGRLQAPPSGISKDVPSRGGHLQWGCGCYPCPLH